MLMPYLESSASARAAQPIKSTSRLFEIARVLVRLDHVASFTVNANHSIMRAAEKLSVVDRVADCIRLAIPQPTEWQHIGDQIDAALVPARSHFVSVL